MEVSDKQSNDIPKQNIKGGLDSAHLTFETLLKEAWENYLAAKSDGTAVQRSTALKAVYEQLLLQRKQEGNQNLDQFQRMDDGELLSEVKRLLVKLSSTLGVKIEFDCHDS